MLIRRLALALLLSLGIASTGCESGDAEQTSESLKERMKEMEKRAKESMPKTQENALKQKADPETVKKVQAELMVLKEYLDEPTGKIDFVTVNAVQAFQHRVGLTEDGLLDTETLQRLEQEAAAAKEGKTDYWARRQR